jgi:hypothetical protein
LPVEIEIWVEDGLHVGDVCRVKTTG